MASAVHFIHFVTYTLDMFFQGILTVISKKVPVRGVIGLPPDNLKRGLIKEGASSALKNRAGTEIYFDRTEPFKEAHQKLLIIDGVLAFAGSMNLTWNAMDKLSREVRREYLDVITPIAQVKKLNNEYFSPLFQACQDSYYKWKSESGELPDAPF